MERLWPLGKRPSTGGRAAYDGAGGVGGRKVGWDEEEEWGRWRGGWKCDAEEGVLFIVVLWSVLRWLCDGLLLQDCMEMER